MIAALDHAPKTFQAVSRGLPLDVLAYRMPNGGVAFEAPIGRVVVGIDRSVWRGVVRDKAVQRRRGPSAG